MLGYQEWLYSPSQQQLALPLMFALGSPNVWCPGLENLGSRTFFFLLVKSEPTRVEWHNIGIT